MLLHSTRTKWHINWNFTIVCVKQYVLQNKRPGVLRNCIIHFHDNATHQNVHSTLVLLKSLYKNVCNHPLCSSYLVLINFHEYHKLKKCQNEIFTNDDQAKLAILCWYHGQEQMVCNVSKKCLQKGLNTFLNRVLYITLYCSGYTNNLLFTCATYFLNSKWKGCNWRISKGINIKFFFFFEKTRLNLYGFSSNLV